MISLRKIGQQKDEQHLRTTAETQVVELAELRYKGGVSDYLPVLDAQRSLFNAEIDEATSASEHARSLIQLYKALGGGWPVPKAKDANEKAARALPTASSASPAAAPSPTPSASPAPPPSSASPAAAPSPAKPSTGG